MRNAYDIIADMLKVTLKKVTCKFSHIMYGANLSYPRVYYYLEFCIKNNLLQNNPFSYYTVTDKGLRYLHAYEKMRGILES